MSGTEALEASRSFDPGLTTRRKWSSAIAFFSGVPVPLVAATAAVVIGAGRIPLWPSPDQALYAAVATSLRAGRGLVMADGGAFLVRPPMLPLLFAVGAGSPAQIAGWMNFVSLASLALVIFTAVHLTTRLTNSKVGAIATATILLYPGLVTALVATPIDTITVGLILAALSQAISDRSDRGFGIGVLVGLAVLTKESALFLAPILPLARLALGTWTLRWQVDLILVTALMMTPWLAFRSAAGADFLGLPLGSTPEIWVAIGIALGVLIWASARWGAPLAAQPKRLPSTAIGGVGALWLLAVGVGVLMGNPGPGRPELTWGRIRNALHLLEPSLGLSLPVSLAVLALAIALIRPAALRSWLAVGIVAPGIPIVLFVASKQWSDLARHVLLALTLASVAVGIAIGEGVSARRRVLRWGMFAAALLSMLSVGLAAATSPPQPDARDRGRRAAVRDVADFVLAESGPGGAIVSSWYGANNLYTELHGKRRVLQAPTVELTATESGDRLFREVGSLFRYAPTTDSSREARQDDWLFIRYHTLQAYFVGLSLSDLKSTLKDSKAELLVISGEHFAQSTTTIAGQLGQLPWLEPIYRNQDMDPTYFVYRVRHERLSSSDVSQLELNADTFEPLLASIAQARTISRSEAFELLWQYRPYTIPMSGRDRGLADSLSERKK